MIKMEQLQIKLCELQDRYTPYTQPRSPRIQCITVFSDYMTTMVLIKYELYEERASVWFWLFNMCCRTQQCSYFFIQVY
jgi:hypothetical protein